MAWTRSQIITVQKYRRWAGLADLEYRGLLKEITGAFSSREPHLTNWHFDNFMASIEARLAREIEEGVVPAPAGVKLCYWRARCPRDGQMNSRYKSKIDVLWAQLCPLLPDTSRTKDYLAAIATHACGYPIRDIYQVKAWQARLLIEALRDRLQHGLKAAAAPALASSTAPQNHVSAGDNLPGEDKDLPF